jgi:hypothetical protein
VTEHLNMLEIISPSDEYQRTEHLRLLLDSLASNPNYAIDETVKSFLRGFVTKDFRQAALVGLILLKLKDIDALSAYARMFCALTLNHEPKLKQAIIQAMPPMSPGDLYDELADITVYGDPKSATYHYAFLVLSKVNADSLRKDFSDYQRM